MKAKDLKTTTIRLQPETRSRLAQRNNVNLNSLVEKLLNRWADDPSILEAEKVLEPRSHPTMKQLREEIANSVARHLQENHDWINDVILDAQPYREGESIFGDRIDHFVEEKQFLAARFTSWLLKRILSYLRQGRQVVLVLDSGTTLYWIFRQLGPQLLNLAPKEPLLERLLLVTNNIPCVDFYMTISRLKPFKRPDSAEEVGLSDYINCKLLTGTVLAKYAAVTGNDTEKELEQQRAEFPDALFIGLVAGNWNRIDSRGPHHAIPLARGRGHGPFKKTLIKICDEIYVPAPLGKIFLTPGVDEVNHALGYGEGQGEDQAPYLEVPVSGDDYDKTACVKLVSTLRPSGQLLYTHSEIVKKTYLARPDTNYEVFLTSNIEDIPVMLFQFDGLANRSLQKQVEIEFPHTSTRDPAFMQEYFSVPVQR